MWAGALAGAKITRVPVTLTGPFPYDLTGHLAPLGFCAVCAAAWKAVAFETQGREVMRADAAPAHSTIALTPPPATPPPALAVAYALAALPVPAGQPGAGQPALVPLPLCWTHIQAVSFTGSGLIPAPAGILLGGGPPGRPRT